MKNNKPSTDPLQHVGLVRTDMHCHSCSKDFIAVLNYDLEGDQEIECIHCGHIHYRGIKAGKVTEARYNTDSRSRAITDDEKRVVWKAKTQPVATFSSAHYLMRDLWLRREE